MRSPNFTLLQSLIVYLAMVAALSANIECSYAQTPTTTSTITSATTTRTQTKSKTPATRLKKRKAKAAKLKTVTRTTVTTRTGLAGGVSHSRHHRVVKSTRLRTHTKHERIDAKQQARLNKLNTFLKHPPAMKKTPYFNHPGLDTPSSPAL